MLTVGDKLPEFSLKSCVSREPGHEFEEIQHDSFQGKWQVLFFWPMDFTFVCPTEIQAFAEKSADFKSRNAVLLGASTDSHYVHLAWRNADERLQNLPFPMLADIKRELCQGLGILHQDAGVALRATFVVDPKGVIRFASVNDLSTGRNVDEVLRTLDALQTGVNCPVNWKKGEATL